MDECALSAPGVGQHPSWGLPELLRRYPELRLKPGAADTTVIIGTVRCYEIGPGNVEVDTSYRLELRIAADYPKTLPVVVETDGVIERSFHRNEDWSLCLASPTRIRLAISRNPELAVFVDHFVIPYLYGHAFYRQTGQMPFDELDHGAKGLEKDVLEVFEFPPRSDASAILRLAGLRKRDANKHLCPCNSGARLGKCHSSKISRLRDELGRAWWSGQLKYLLSQISARA